MDDTKFAYKRINSVKRHIAWRIRNLDIYSVMDVKLIWTLYGLLERYYKEQKKNNTKK